MVQVNGDEAIRDNHLEMPIKAGALHLLTPAQSVASQPAQRAYNQFATYFLLSRCRPAIGQFYRVSGFCKALR